MTRRVLVIVARHELKLYYHLKEALASFPIVQVVYDRRQRIQWPPSEPPRRGPSRRLEDDLTQQLRTVGYAVVKAHDGLAGSKSA